MLDFGVYTDNAAGIARPALRQVDDVLQGDDAVLAIVAVVAIIESLFRPQGLDFGERKIAGEKVSGLDAVQHAHAFTIGEFGVAQHVRRHRQQRFVTHDQMAVGGRNHVGLDEIRAHADGHLIAGNGVLGQIARCAAMADDQRPHRRGEGSGRDAHGKSGSQKMAASDRHGNGLPEKRKPAAVVTRLAVGGMRVLPRQVKKEKAH